jgi:hypothetical protein
LREEARKYGIISNEAAAESEKFMDAEENLKRAMTGLSNEIGSALMPKFTDIIQGAADFVAGIDDLEGKLRMATIVIASTATALGTFLTVAKGKAAIDAVTLAVKGLTTALAANPIAAVAALVAAVAVPAFFALADHADKAANKVHYLSEELKENNKKYTEAQGLIKDSNKEKAIDFETTEKLVKLYPDLTGMIKANATTYGEAADAIERLNRAKTVDTIDAQVKAYQERLDVIEKTKASVESMEKAQANGVGALGMSIDSAKKKLTELTDANVRDFNLIGSNYEKLGQKLTDITQNGVFVEIMPKIVPPPPPETKATGEGIARTAAQIDADAYLAKNTARNEELIAAKEHADALAKIQSDYNEVWKAEQEAKAVVAAQATASEQLNMDIATLMLEEALAKRKEIEDNENKARADATLALEENTRNNEALIFAKRLKDEQDYTKAVNEETKRRIELRKQEFSAAANLAGAMSQLIEAAGQEDRGAAIAAKALSAAEAAINTGLAVTKTIAEYGATPLGIAAAATAAAIGAANITKIVTTPLPSAETGGRFEVPSTFTGVDSALMRVNAGETVTVEPRGAGGYPASLHIVVNIARQPILDIVQDAITSHELQFDTERNV